jgi:hypothetical protein
MYETPEAAILAWVNLNRFAAHLSVQQRLTPVAATRLARRFRPLDHYPWPRVSPSPRLYGSSLGMA